MSIFVVLPSAGITITQRLVRVLTAGETAGEGSGEEREGRRRGIGEGVKRERVGKRRMRGRGGKRGT